MDSTMYSNRFQVIFTFFKHFNLFRNIEIILACPKGIEEGVWKYEHLRQFCMELNGLAVLLQVKLLWKNYYSVKEECKPDICGQMTATEQWVSFANYKLIKFRYFYAPHIKTLKRYENFNFH